MIRVEDAGACVRTAALAGSEDSGSLSSLEDKLASAG